MAEPEDLIIEGAHLATRLASDVWRRYGPPGSPRHVPLTRVRTRLELFVSALLGAPLTIAPREPPAPASWLARLAEGARRQVADQALFPGTDGRRICLPPVLPIDVSEQDTLALYRLLAIEQAMRLLRGTVRLLEHVDDDEIRDRFLVAEGAVIDRWLTELAPGLTPVLRAARTNALRHRQRVRAPRLRQDSLEHELQAILSADPRLPVYDLALDASPGQSLAWARATAARDALPGRYRRLAPVWHWGDALAWTREIRAADRPSPDSEPPASRTPPLRVAEMRRSPRVREASDDEDDENSGTWVIRADEPQESVEDPHGLQRPTDRNDAADPEGLGDSLSELPEARVVRTPERAREVLRSGEELHGMKGLAPPIVTGRGIAYPEWDYRVGQYRFPGAMVREPPAPLGDAAWVTSALCRHGRLTRRVRARFERLRPRLVRCDRQPDGPELDIAAWVDMAADMLAGGTVDGRLYSSVRRSRRELTVALLVDVSASTDSWVSGSRRVVDVEKDALLVVCEALDALGDRFGIFAFSGEGAENISVSPLKTFHDRTGEAVRRRIAALESDRYTRIGVAIRHVTAMLCRQRTSRRLLLVLSDGKPNDVDVYEGRYGVEDARQAVAEARRQGVDVFCLTIDREAPRYAARMFGRAGFAVLHKPEQLPTVLIEALRQLVRS